MKELIERLREYDINGKVVHSAADALEQQAKQIEELTQKLDQQIVANAALTGENMELAAALVVRDEALRFYAEHPRCAKAIEALSAKPHAALVAKIKEDAIAEYIASKGEK